MVKLNDTSIEFSSYENVDTVLKNYTQMDRMFGYEKDLSKVSVYVKLSTNADVFFRLLHVCVKVGKGMHYLSLYDFACVI